MPSPFPGMDPYLESDLWTSFHALLAAEVVRQLNPKLRPRYVAMAERHHLAGDPRDVFISPKAIIPDVRVRPIQPTSGGAATAPKLQAPLLVQTVMRVPLPQMRVAVRDVENRTLVTVIELLSPTNKRGPGRRKYPRKRERILDSATHLIEVDLFRKGRRVPIVETLPKVPYFVFLGRSEKRPLTEVWPIDWQDKLPEIPVPLLEGDEDVTLDLQAAFTACYDVGNFDLVIDYAKPPAVALRREAAAWMDGVLRAAGKRP